jgi:hypothetical protein
MSLISAGKYDHKEENQQETCMLLIKSVFTDAAGVTVCVSIRSHHWRRNGSDVGFPRVSENVPAAVPVKAGRLSDVE